MWASAWHANPEAETDKIEAAWRRAITVRLCWAPVHAVLNDLEQRLG